MDSFTLFGIRIFNATMQELADEITKKAEAGEFCHVVTVNSLILLQSIFSKKYRTVLQNASYCVADSVGVKFAARLIGVHLREKVPGIDLIRLLMYWGEQHYKSFYLLGGRYDVIMGTERNVKTSYPGIRVVGRYQGYFTKNDEKQINLAVRKASPDFTFVALGAPKQEYWIYNNATEAQLKVAVGVGGAFDVFAGRKKRASEKIRHSGFEWLYRILTNPLRLYQLFPLFLFGLLILGNGAVHGIRGLLNRHSGKKAKPAGNEKTLRPAPSEANIPVSEELAGKESGKGV